MPLQCETTLASLWAPHPEASIILTTYGHHGLAIGGEGTSGDDAAVATEHLGVASTANVT